MRRQDHIPGSPDRRIFGEGLLAKDVEADAGERVGGEGVEQGGLVDQRAAGGVDQERGGFEQAELVGADDALGGVRQDEVETDDVTLLEEELERGRELDPGLVGAGLVQVRGPPDYAQSKCFAHLRSHPQPWSVKGKICRIWLGSRH